MPLQIILPISADDVKDVAVAVILANVIVDDPTTSKELLGARLTGVSCIVTAGPPATSVVPAITMGSDGRTTTGRLYGPVIVAVARRTVGVPLVN